jgi:uncharacterized protein YrrD
MLNKTKNFYGAKLGALDGDIGHIKDFYFDDSSWVVRYLIADTGSWLTGRQVLLSPHSFGKWDEDAKLLHINLRKKQIENSPAPDTHRPVSRQYEIEFYQYYGWPTYWEGTGIWGFGGMPVAVPPPTMVDRPKPSPVAREDRHLRSAKAVAGYAIQAEDGEMGHVTGFLVDDKQWSIHDVVVEAGKWYSGKEILVPVGKVKSINYEELAVAVALTQSDIRQTTENEVAHHHRTESSR